MQSIIYPGNIDGIIFAPASKSCMQRACAAALLHEGETIIHHKGSSEDDLTTLEIIKQLGAIVIEQANGDLFITGKKKFQHSPLANPSIINCNESGLALRMFAPIIAMQSSASIITGKGSLMQRPIDPFLQIFSLLGVSIDTNNGKLPITIQGPIKPTDIEIEGSSSSQYLTGLLFALAKLSLEPLRIKVNNLISTPYVDLTLEILEHFGYNIVNEGNQYFTIHPTTPVTSIIEYTIEGDWSGASFLLVAGAVAGSIEIKGLNVQSKQADKSILQVLNTTGARLSISDESIKIEKPIGNKKLLPFNFDATHCPDLFPPLVALAAYCDGISVIEGVDRLSGKESNRAKSLQDTFAVFGVKIDLQDNLMIIHGGGEIRGGNVSSCNDHRIAMSAAIVGLKSTNKVIIEDAQVVNKSYPNFFKDISSVFKIK